MTSEERLEKYRKEFDELMDRFGDVILIDKSCMDDAQKQQLHLQREFGSVYAKVSALLKDCEAETEEAFADAFTEAMADAYKDRSTTEAKYHAQKDKEYMTRKRFENKVFRLKKRIETEVDTIETRKYILKDIHQAVLNGTNKHII
jgi:hypothetical protein